ncbi:preprotein translocase, YajC subunit [Peptostreptococcaceae bacterium AS15]|nr:preprotein translocase, YajC subunit [[Eubacterium] yurii subsp. margaretiae ATCC 43715]EJP26064.1 preprotein translocase, YajC subunit [Peptostreptococcaceae bacterium AS15]
MVAYAQGANAAAGGAGGLLFPLVIMVAFFYFFIIKPQKKRQQQMEDMKSSLKVGDKVVLYSGLVAVIVAVEEDELILEVEPDNVRLRFKNWCIRNVVADENEPVDDDNPDETDDESTSDNVTDTNQTEEEVIAE